LDQSEEMENLNFFHGAKNMNFNLFPTNGKKMKYYQLFCHGQKFEFEHFAGSGQYKNEKFQLICQNFSAKNSTLSKVAFF
jgi:hypothetical protein